MLGAKKHFKKNEDKYKVSEETIALTEKDEQPVEHELDRKKRLRNLDMESRLIRSRNAVIKLNKTKKDRVNMHTVERDYENAYLQAVDFF